MFLSLALILLACEPTPTAPSTPAATPPAAAPVPSPPAPAGEAGPELPVQSGLARIIADKDGGVKVPGRIERIEGGISLDPANPADARGELRIALASWNSDLELRDTRVKETFFGVGKAADPVFELQGIEGVEGSLVAEGARVSGRAKGELRFGASRLEMSLPVSLERLSGPRYAVKVEEFPVSIAALGLDEARRALMQLCQHKDLADTVLVQVELQLGPGGR